MKAMVFTNLSPTITLLVISPIAVQEMVMAGWLIVKGFNPSAIASLTVQQTPSSQIVAHAR